MGWIADNFGTYAAYRTWSNKRHYDYHVKLTYGASTEILIINPGGISEMGIKVEESKIYLGRLYSINLGLRFANKSGGGGDILKDSLYSVDGIKAECTVEIVKLNKTTKDFDPYFTGIADFTTYKYNVDENGLGIITIDLLEQSDIQKFLARENIELDITKNVSIGGVTITDVPDQDVTFKGVNYYRYAEANSGSISGSTNFPSTQTDYEYFDSGGLVTDSSGRFNFDPSGGKLYTNTLGESIDMKIELDVPYSIESECGVGSSLTIAYQMIVYNSGGTPLTTKTLATITNIAGGVQIDTGTLTNTYTYTDITIPDDGYLVFRAKIDAVKGAGICDLTNMNFTGVRLYQFWEKSLTIGDTIVVCYQIYQAFLKISRLMLDRDDCFESDFLTNVSQNVNYEYITSVKNLRGFPTSWVKVSFRELFEHVRSMWQVALDYDRVNNVLKIVPDSEIYDTTTRLDLGVIKNLKFEPTEYYSEIEAGYKQDGNIEALQGVQMTHLKSNYSMDFPDDGKLNVRGEFIMSAYEMEFYRRQQYSTLGQTDTKKDDKICYVYATGAPTVSTVQASTFSGWEGIDEIYNPNTTPRQNLMRNNFLKGYYKYDTGGTIRFVSNKKNVEYSYYVGYVVGETDNITVSNLPNALCLPEQIEGEVAFTPTIKDAIDSNIYGVWTVTDEAGEEYEAHITKLEFNDSKEKIVLTAKLHNA